MANANPPAATSRKDRAAAARAKATAASQQSKPPAAAPTKPAPEPNASVNPPAAPPVYVTAAEFEKEFAALRDQVSGLAADKVKNSTPAATAPAAVASVGTRVLDRIRTNNKWTIGIVISFVLAVAVGAWLLGWKPWTGTGSAQDVDQEVESLLRPNK